MKFLMNKIEIIAKNNECWSDNVTDWNLQYCKNIWETVGDEIIDRYSSKKYGVDTQWKTIYNNMSKENSK